MSEQLIFNATRRAIVLITQRDRYNNEIYGAAMLCYCRQEAAQRYCAYMNRKLQLWHSSWELALKPLTPKTIKRLNAAYYITIERTRVKLVLKGRQQNRSFVHIVDHLTF